MLNSPIRLMAPAPTTAGRWHDATKPGMWIAMKLTCRPQTKKPQQRYQKVGVRSASRSASPAVCCAAAPGAGAAGWSFSGSASGIISREAPATSSSAAYQPKPEMPKLHQRHRQELAEGGPAVPSPVARPRCDSGSSRVRLAMITGMPAAETAKPMTMPAKKVNIPKAVRQRHAGDADKLQQRPGHDHAAGAEAVGDLPPDRLGEAVDQHL